MCVPLSFDGHVIGAIYVDSIVSRSRPFGGEGRCRRGWPSRPDSVSGRDTRPDAARKAPVSAFEL